MKRFKSIICVLLSALMLMSILTVAPITASAMKVSEDQGSSSTDVVLDPNIAADEDFFWVAWTWSDNKDSGKMITGIKDGDNYVFRGLSKKVTFGMIFNDTEDPTWNDRDEYTTIDYDVAGNKFVITGWSEDDDDIYEVWGCDYYVGTWSNVENTNTEQTSSESSSSETAYSEDASSESNSSEAAGSEDASSENTASESTSSESSTTEPVDTSVVVLDPGIAADDDFIWIAWTWSDDKDSGKMIKSEKNGDNFIFRGLSKKVTFGAVYSDTENPTWSDREDYTTIDYDVTGNKFVITGWSEDDEDIYEVWGYDYYVGTWSTVEITNDLLVKNNTLAVSATTKTIKASALKKANVTVKPLAITKAIGTVTATLVKEGTTSSIYSNVTVNKSTGAITIKKGSYKAGTYKVAVSVKAAGNTNYKAKTIKKTATIVIKGKAANTLTVKASTKTLKLFYMKKAKQTAKPLKISKAKGSVKVVKVKSGTTSKIYKNISVNAKTGAISFRKGTYSKGTYKVKLKITCKGNDDYKSKSITKTVKIVIKDRKANPLTVTSNQGVMSAESMKKSKNVVEPLFVKGAQGKVKIKKLKNGTSTYLYGKITIKNNAKIYFKKGSYKTGDYTLKVKVTAAGNGNYKKKTVTTTIKIKIVKKFTKCSKCNGTGKVTCSKCNGAGYFLSSFIIWIYNTPYRYKSTCSTCSGTGKETCSKCNGTGYSY